MISSYILPMLFTTMSICHALYLQSSVLLSTANLANSSSLQKKHQLRYATHHHPSTTYSIPLAFSTATHHRSIPRISNKRCTTILNSALNNNNEQQQIDNDNDNEEHLVGIGVGIDLGTTNSAIAMMIPSTDIDGSEEDDSSRYVRIYIWLVTLSSTYHIKLKCSHLMHFFLILFILSPYTTEEQYQQCYQ